MNTTTLNSRFRVNSNGFALFIIGLTVAGFVGGGVRFFLNSERSQERILSELKSKLPEWKIEADRAELLLASGVWPGLTIVVPKARLVKSNEARCELLTIQLADLRLPISMWSMIKGSGRLGHAYAQELDVEFDNIECERPDALKVGESNSATGAVISNDKGLGLDRLYRDIQKRIDGLRVDKLVVSDSRSGNWSLSANRLYIDVGSQVHAEGEISFWQRFDSGEIRQNFYLRANLQGSLLDWSLKSPIKEGEIVWAGQIDELGRTFLQRLELNQAPVGDLVDILRTSGLMKKSFLTKRAWVNCRISQGGSFKKIKDIETLPIRIDSCGLDGESGKIRVSPVTAYWKPPHLRNGPLEVSVSQIPLQSVADFVGARVADRVIHDLGRWSGSGNIYGPEKWNLHGEIEGVKLNISNQSLRGAETLSSVRLKAEKTWDQLRIMAFDFRIPGGSRGGEVVALLDPKSLNGSLSLKFEGLSLSSGVQDLLFRGRGEAINLSGEGNFVFGKLQDFHGEFKWSSVKGRGWYAENIRGDFSLKDQEMDSKIFIKKFVWTKDYFYSAFLEKLKPKLLLDNNLQNLTDISMDLRVDEKGGSVKRTIGHLDNKILQFTGGWVRSGALTGKVTSTPAAKAIVEITGKSAQILK